MNKYGYPSADNEQTEDIIRRFMDIYDSLGTVLDCESKYDEKHIKINLNFH